MAYIFADYAGKLAQLEGEAKIPHVGLALLVIVVLTCVNILGVRFGKSTQNILTAFKVLGLAAILVTGLWFARTWEVSAYRAVYENQPMAVVEGRFVAVDASGRLRLRDDEDREWVFPLAKSAKITIDNEKQPPAALADLAPGTAVKLLVPEAGGAAVRVKATTLAPLGALALALILVLWTYAGWHEAAYVAAEVQNRRRNLPLALLLGTATVTLLYLLVNVAYLIGLGYEGAADSPAVAADVLKLLPGHISEQTMCLLVMLSALGAINGMIFTTSRIFSEMGADHQLFTALSKWDPRWGTPVRSLLAQAAISVGMVTVVGLGFRGKSGFVILVNCTAAVFWLFFLLTGLALIVLRFRDRNIERPFVTPLYPLPALVFCFFCGFMLYGSVTYAPHESLVGLAILAAGVPLYLVSRASRPQAPPPVTLPTADSEHVRPTHV